jgi:hypothetical protein
MISMSIRVKEVAVIHKKREKEVAVYFTYRRDCHAADYDQDLAALLEVVVLLQNMGSSPHSFWREVPHNHRRGGTRLG